MRKDHILIGRFGAPHGIGGGIRLAAFTSDPWAIASYKPLLDERGEREFKILGLRELKDNLFIARIEGICGRASAKALTNTAIYLPRAFLPETGEDEYYIADLIGLEVMTEACERFGRVVNVLNFGGGDILELAREGSAEIVLLPFKKDIFPQVDLEAGRLIAVPPIGIADETARAAS
jgi:16S rRNA processing protein RimM